MRALETQTDSGRIAEKQQGLPQAGKHAWESQGHFALRY